MESIGSEISFRRRSISVRKSGVAEVIRVTRSRYGEISGLISASRRRTRDGPVGNGSGGVKCGRIRGYSGSLIAMKPAELAARIYDHGDILGRSADSEGDSETDIVAERKFVWRSRERARWDLLDFEW